MKTPVQVLLISSMLLTATVATANEFQKWMQQQQSDFQEYKDKRDKEFTAFLKQNWKQVDLLQGVKRDEKPKPVRLPVAKPVPKAPVVSRTPQPAPAPVSPPVVVAPPPVPVVPVPGITTGKAPEPRQPVTRPTPVPDTKTVPQATTRSAPIPQPVKPVPLVKSPPVIVPPVKPVKPSTGKRYQGRKMVLSYYGDKITLFYDPALRVSVNGRINKQLISDTWSRLSRTDFEPLVEQLNDIRKSRNLNDWAFAVLVDDFSSKLAGSNARTFLNWFLLIKSNFEARIAYDSNTITLLLPTQQKLYAVSYFTLEGTKYYAVNFDGGSHKLGRVYTYDGKYPGATDSLDMRLTTDMIDTGRGSDRKLRFEFKGKRYEVDAYYDRERVAFLDSYPQLDLDMYFAAKVADRSASKLHAQLANHIKSMSELDAVNFLLRFVQTSFEYKTDDEQFGKENYLFPEETLHYRYSDCEDRSVLFAWLVNNLLGLETVGLDYPGHVAVAVNFKSSVKGDAVTWKGKRYVVTDPTYVNAVAGMTMPQYRTNTPKVIQTGI